MRGAVGPGICVLDFDVSPARFHAAELLALARVPFRFGLLGGVGSFLIEAAAALDFLLLGRVSCPGLFGLGGSELTLMIGL
jgi:hypothetical protein